MSNLNRKITQNKSKYLLVENELNKLKTFDSSYFTGKSHFGEDDTQNYLVFPPMYRYFEMITNTDYISSWKSKGVSAESFKPPKTFLYVTLQLLSFRHVCTYLSYHIFF